MGSRRSASLLDSLRTGPLVFDGAMGTQLYERGILYTQNFDQLCVTRGDLVQSVHASYVAAGADVLQTNTFGANRYRLHAHNLENQLEAINRAGVAVARAAAGDKAWVTGSIGPTGLILKTVRTLDHAELRAAFREQAAVLIDT